MRTVPAAAPAATPQYRPAVDVAYVVGRPYRTIQTWARDGRIASRRDGRGRLLVDLVAAARLSRAAGRRRRPADEG